jgi:serine/threonine protein kinase/tetratricopeptide (TPR) repeat protein
MADDLRSPDMIGQILGHYRIVERVAAGGFGVVYRAHDEQLERDVAVKVLPAGTLNNETSRRNFRKEALALAKLNHANIETVYEFGSQDGIDFLVMEYVAGKTLTEKLMEGSLPEKELVSLAMQIVEAVEEAHDRGIVHRDLKPANILITPKGQAKVLDFGLAKWLRPGEELTADHAKDTLSTAGTLPYMSPEQLNDEAVDQRTDIYSLGAMFYEMAVNQKVFSRPLTSQVIDAIFNQAPVSLRVINPRISPSLDDVVMKCLEKDPAHRYQSAKELLVDFRRMTARSSVVMPVVRPRRRFGRKKLFVIVPAALVLLALAMTFGHFDLRSLWERIGSKGAPQIHSLAVLPLENLSKDPDQDYFADGMTDELITDLSRISALRVISHTSIMGFKNTNKPLPEIANSLHVDALVEGSIQRSGQRVKVNARLIRASGSQEQQVWARSYERDLSDVLTLQTELAMAIANEVRIQLTQNEKDRLAEGRSINPEAHEAYLAGRYYWNKRTGEGLEKSISYLEKAIAKDPKYALAYAALADSYHLLPELSNVSVGEAFPKARTAALKALEIDDSVGEAHSALASIKEDYDWDWKGAEVEYRKAIELSPGDEIAHAAYSNLLLELGRFPEALTQAKIAQSLDPLSVFANDNLAAMLYYAGEYDQAIEQCKKTLELDPRSHQAHRHLAEVYTQRHMYPQAVSELKAAMDLSPANFEALAELGYVYGISGMKNEAQAVLERIKANRSVSAYRLAIVYAGLGQNDEVLKALREAVNSRAPGIVHLKVAPFFSQIRSQDQFQKLLVDMGLANSM